MNTMLKVLLSVFCLLFFTSCVASKTGGQSSCSENLEKAGGFYKDGKIFEARSLYQQALEECEPNVDTFFHLALLSMKSGDYAESQEYFFKVIALDPVHQKAYYDLGVLFSSETKTQNLAKAKICFEKYLMLSDNDKVKASVSVWLKDHEGISVKGIFLQRDVTVFPNLEKGLAAYKEKQYHEASGYLRGYLLENGDDLEARFKLGVCYLNLGDPEQSRNVFLELLIINEYFPKAYYNLAVLYASNKVVLNEKKAVFFFKKYVAIAPYAEETPRIQQWLKAH